MGERRLGSRRLHVLGEAEETKESQNPNEANELRKPRCFRANFRRPSSLRNFCVHGRGGNIVVMMRCPAMVMARRTAKIIVRATVGDRARYVPRSSTPVPDPTAPLPPPTEAASVSVCSSAGRGTECRVEKLVEHGRQETFENVMNAPIHGRSKTIETAARRSRTKYTPRKPSQIYPSSIHPSWNCAHAGKIVQNGHFN